MPVETGNLTQLAYIAETTFGSTPATPTGQLLRWTAMSLVADANYIDNPELRRDNMKAVGRRGSLRGKGSLSGKLSYGTYDDFFAAALSQFAWASNVVKVHPLVTDTAATLQMTASTKTLTRTAGSFVTDGFVTGDGVITSGFTNAGNNVQCFANVVSALTMTLTTTATLVDEAANAAASVTTNLRPSFTFEKGHLANSIYFPYLGAVIDGFTLSGKINDAVDVSFDILTKSVSNEATASLFTSLTAVNTNPLMTSWDGSIKRNTVAIASIASWTLKVARSSDSAEVCGSSALYDIQPKAAQISGSLELWFDSVQSYADFRAETDIALQFILGPGANKTYQIDLTKCRYKNWKGDPKDGMFSVTCDFESYAPDSGVNTSFMLTRLP